MPTAPEHLSIVIEGLTDGLLEPAEVTAIHQLGLQIWEDAPGFIAAYPDDYGWFLDLGYDLAAPDDRKALTGHLLTYVLINELADFMAISDKSDELHEKIVWLFEDSTLPGFPPDLSQIERAPEYAGHPKMGGEEYFGWLRGQMRQHHPQYQILVLDDGLGDEVAACPVPQEAMERVVASCRWLSIRLGPY
jgi:hypothetical protein